jgi:hypothetical protein
MLLLQDQQASTGDRALLEDLHAALRSVSTLRSQLSVAVESVSSDYLAAEGIFLVKLRR